MLFKMTITKTAADGSTNKIELENGDAIQDQGALFDFLRPLITDPTAEPTEIFLDNLSWMAPEPEAKIEQRTSGQAIENLGPNVISAKLVDPEPEKVKPVINRPKQDPPEKAFISKVSERETGIVEIHCPSCGLETAKRISVKADSFRCPTCNEKLGLYALNAVRGEPNERGISFEANRIFMSARERWELKNGK